ncbi:MAG: hypothetical protein COB36_07555 [Alphaproteobacteria bacterium]|nr:MAG: hypothetical protein COB36_07555 [Alphaproteobacteria bacterium]
MSNNFEEFSNAALIRNRVCMVAYTLNGEQPVISTHIGDQPLYYMDEEIIEDEELFDPAELDMLAHEIRTLKEEMSGLDETPFFIPENTMLAFQEFAENAESFGIDLSLSKQEKEQRLKDVLNILGESRLASSYLNVAEKHDIKIMMSEQIEKAFYDRRSGSILINPNMQVNEQVLLLSRELRRHWQHRQGVLINPLMFQPENAILINRAQEADLVVSVIRTAWELQLAGIRDVWERVENSPMADLSRAYAREAFMDFRTINNGVASTAVFEAWFLSERCRQQDKKIIQAMLADYNGYVFESSTSSENVTAELISGLGEMPFGKNYLSAHAVTIMEDPIFAEVRDRSNANFLWFIKFERTFKETEQHLQLESDLSTHGIRHELLKQNSQDQIDGHEQSADIIQLFEHQPKIQKENDGKKLSSNSKRSAQIIDLKRWSSKK